MSNETNNTPETPSEEVIPSTPITNSNDAVNLAAEQAKETAHKNIPALDGLPVPSDTANLREGENLNDALLALLPLVGVWRGAGEADPTDGDSYPFGQQITFSHDGGPYLNYESKTWRKDAEGNDVMDRRESGFMSINNADVITFITTHTDGMVEIMYGKPLNERAWELESASTLATEEGKQHGPGRRLFGLMPNNNLGWVDERLVDGEMRPWMSAELSRAIG